MVKKVNRSFDTRPLLEIEEVNSARLLREFKNRFDKSVLYEMEITALLEIIGIEKIKEHLKEERGYRLVKIKNHWRHNL